MWEWKVGSTDYPICTESNNEGIVGTPIASLWDFHATINVFSVCLVLWYIRKQRLKAASGNNSPDREMICGLKHFIIRRQIRNTTRSYNRTTIASPLSKWDLMASLKRKIRVSHTKIMWELRAFVTRRQVTDRRRTYRGRTGSGGDSRPGAWAAASGTRTSKGVSDDFHEIRDGL